MAYYALVTLFLAWGFLALIAIVSILAAWYVFYALYATVEEYVRPLVDMATEIRDALAPATSRMMERARTYIQALTAQQLRS